MASDTAGRVPPEPAAAAQGEARAAAARRDALRGHAALLLFAASISISFSLGKRVAPHIAPEALTAARFLVGALALAPLAVPLARAAHAAAPWRYGVIGGLFAAYFVLMFEALRRADAVPLAAVFTLTPAMGALCGWLLLAQRTSPRAALAIALGAAGALWVVFRGDWAAAAAFDVGAGEALYFVGCALHALYAALVRRLNRGEPAVVFALGSFLGAMLVALAWGGGALVATDWAALPPVAWIAIVYLGLGATAGSFLLMRYGAMRLPAGKVTAYGYAVPVFVILWEGLATGQWVALAVLPGVALIAAALAVLVAEHDRA